MVHKMEVKIELFWFEQLKVKGITMIYQKHMVQTDPIYLLLHVWAPWANGPCPGLGIKGLGTKAYEPDEKAYLHRFKCANVFNLCIHQFARNSFRSYTNVSDSDKIRIVAKKSSGKHLSLGPIRAHTQELSLTDGVLFY